MKKKLFLSLLTMLCLSMSSCYAQQVISETNLFEWSNGNIVPKSIFIELDDQPSGRKYPLKFRTLLSSFSVVYRCSNN